MTFPLLLSLISLLINLFQPLSLYTYYSLPFQHSIHMFSLSSPYFLSLTVSVGPWETLTSPYAILPSVSLVPHTFSCRFSASLWLSEKSLEQFLIHWSLWKSVCVCIRRSGGIFIKRVWESVMLGSLSCCRGTEYRAAQMICIRMVQHKNKAPWNIAKCNVKFHFQAPGIKFSLKRKTTAFVHLCEDGGVSEGCVFEYKAVSVRNTK